MFDLHSFIIFAIASWALIVTPGPDMLYVITCGMSQGRRAGVLSAVGVALGLMVHTCAAAFGLAVLLKTSTLAFLIVKYVGAAYLIYLGVKAVLDEEGLSFEQEKNAKSARSIFWRGVVTNVLNPKVALFFLAFLPQFADASRGNVVVQMILLGLIFIVFGTTFLSSVGYFSGRISTWLKSKPWVAQRLNWMAGCVFIGLGVRLIFLKQK